MSPRREVYLPQGFDEKAFQRAIASVRGDILEIKPARLANVSPVTLARFVEDQEPTFNFDQEAPYSEIFGLLRTLSFEEQEELLVNFFTKGVKDFPNGESLGKFLAKGNNIPSFGPLEKLKPPKLQAKFQTLSDQFFSRLNLPSLPVRIINEGWIDDPRAAQRLKEVRRVGTEEAWDRIRVGRRSTAWVIAKNMAIATCKADAPMCLKTTVVSGALWIVVEDLMHQVGYTKGNPFEPLIDIWRSGCEPVGIRDDELIIFVPPPQKAA